MKIPVWFKYLKGRKFKIYMDGTVKTIDKEREIGYLTAHDFNEIVRLELHGIDLDLFIKDNLNIPATMTEFIEKMFLEMEQKKKYYKEKCMKTFKLKILQDFMTENEILKLTQKYKQAIGMRKSGGSFTQTEEMYNDYINNHLTFRQIADKYKYKGEKIIQKKISNYALELQLKGISPTTITKRATIKRFETVLRSDIEKYINRVDDEKSRVVLERHKLKNETMNSITNDLGISYSYGYILYKNAMNQIIQWIEKE